MSQSGAHTLIEASLGRLAINTTGALKAPAVRKFTWRYLAPSPVTMVFSVLKAIRISNHSEKCLM